MQFNRQKKFYRFQFLYIALVINTSILYMDIVLGTNLAVNPCQRQGKFCINH